ncbi:hypothetical protein BGZ76_001980 [Entomortierella beljakovae]|nr:hypothetical protein BGZ76_001980 [Entomortierella beljakovae]
MNNSSTNTNINCNTLRDIDSGVVATQNEKDETTQSSPPPPPPPTFLQRIRSSIQRLYNSLSFSFKRKLLRNTRLLILALAFIGLILDAITISFEVNVMGLGPSDISTQAALLLIPDILALFMIFFLLVYTSEAVCCCFGISDYDDDDDDDDNEDFNQVHEEQYDNDVDGTQRDFWSTDSANRNTVNRQEEEEKEKSSEQDYKQKGRKQETEINEEEYEEEVLTRNRRNRVSFVNYPESVHRVESSNQYTLSNTPTITITTPYNNNSNNNNINNNSCTDNSKAPDSTSSPNTQANFKSPAASIDVPTSPSTSSDDASRSASMLNTAALSPSEPMDTANSTSSKPMRSRKSLLFYIIFRVFFSLGLAVLAIYWPASRMKPPMGYAPNAGVTYPHAQDGHKTPGRLMDGGGFEDPFGNGSRNNNVHQRLIGSGNDDDEDDDNDDNDGKNRVLKHWCALEQTFGDNQSAIVYCRVKGIRPGVTYGWAALVILELGIAAMAGDFSKDRGRRSRIGVEAVAEGRESNISDEYEDEELGNTSSGAEMTEHNNNRVSDAGFNSPGRRSN